MEIEENRRQDNEEQHEFYEELEFCRKVETFNLLNIIKHTKALRHKFSPITAGDQLLDTFFMQGREEHSIHCFEPGKIYDFFGEAGSGKTNFGLHVAIANALSVYGTEDDSLIYHISVGKGISSRRYQDMVKSLKTSEKYSEKAIENFPTNLIFLEYSFTEGDGDWKFEGR